MRGTSVIAICEMPTMRREITVRNVVFGELRLVRCEDDERHETRDANGDLKT